MRQRTAWSGRSWRRGVGRLLLTLQAVATVSLVAILATSTQAAAAGGQIEIASGGPLTRIIITGDLSCQVAHQADVAFEFYGDEIGSCGTFLSAGDGLYGPEWLSLGPEPWTPVSQSPVAGSGSAADPFRVVTTVQAGTSGLRVEQTDAYVTGEEVYRTDVKVINTGGTEQRIVLFRAADCYLQDSDVGFGRVDDGAPGCVISQASNARIEQWVPITPGSTYMEGDYSEVYAAISQGQPFPNTCLCDTQVDNGAGISWEATVAPGADVTLSHFTFFSPSGHRFSAPGGAPLRDAVPGPDQINLDPVVVASSVALAAGVVFLVPFPAALFNATLEENYAEVTGWWRRVTGRVGRMVGGLVAAITAWIGARLRPSRGADRAEDASVDSATGEADPGAFWHSRRGMATFIGLSALVYSLLDPTFGFNVDSAGTLLGLALGLLITLAAYGVPLILGSRGRGWQVTADALPGTLLIALGCVIISRLADFQPGYLYGLIIGFGFTRALTRVEEGRLEAMAATTGLAVAIACWFALPAVRAGGGGGIGSIILGTAFATAVVAGLEGALVGMLPLRFLPGELVREWNKRYWMGLIGFAALAFFHILINPSSGYLADSERSSMTTVIGLLAVFGLGSVAFWAYFRFLRGPHQTSTPPAATPPAPPPGEVPTAG